MHKLMLYKEIKPAIQFFIMESLQKMNSPTSLSMFTLVVQVVLCLSEHLLHIPENFNQLLNFIQKKILIHVQIATCGMISRTSQVLASTRLNSHTCKSAMQNLASAHESSVCSTDLIIHQDLHTILNASSIIYKAQVF